MLLCTRTRSSFLVHAALGVCWFASAACIKPTLWLGSAAATDPMPSSLAGAHAPQPASQAGSNSPPVVPDVDAAVMSDAASPPDAMPQPPAAQPLPTTDARVADATALPPESEADGGVDERAEPQLPSPNTRCPKLAGSGVYTFGDPTQRTLSVQIYVDTDARNKPAPGGPLILYWHAFGSSPAEVQSGLGQTAIDAIVQQGGVVAAFASKLCATCGLPEDVGWYDDDDAVSDAVVSCAIAQAKIDIRRIHALGLSAGALHTMHLALVRANYIASVVSYSGGGGIANSEPPRRAPGVAVPSLLTYGREGLDVAGFDFNLSSRRWYEVYSPLGWYIMMCEHEGGHEIPEPVAKHALQFLLDHPYGVQPEPYARQIPIVFPSYCQNSPPRR